MKTNTTETLTDIFKAPLTKDELRHHVVIVSLLLARQLHFIFLRPEAPIHEQAQIMLLGMTSTQDINYPDTMPGGNGLELSYENLATTAFANSMEELYEFAYHGMLNGTGYDMNSESSPSWISRILMDLSSSHFAMEWNEYSPCLDSIKALLAVCETAQARMILERVQEDDSFMGWYSYEGHGGLTFRQMALLSGMSEASLRTLANPKRNNPLITQSHGRHTYIDPIHATTWLISKGRYVPLTDTDRTGIQLDLATESITSIELLKDRLDSRLHFMIGTDDADSVTNVLNTIREGLLGKRLIDQTPYLTISDEELAEEDILKKIAKALQLPSDLLVLKVAHLRAQQDAQNLQQRFEEAARKAAAKKD